MVYDIIYIWLYNWLVIMILIINMYYIKTARIECKIQNSYILKNTYIPELIVTSKASKSKRSWYWKNIIKVFLLRKTKLINRAL